MIRHLCRGSLVILLLALNAVDAGAEPIDPPLTIPVDVVADAAALAAWLPEGVRVTYGPVPLTFGAHETGVLVALRTDDPPAGCAVWYLTPEGPGATDWQLIRLRDPDPMDEFVMITPQVVVSVGPDGARDIVMLNLVSRTAAAGGMHARVGEVFRNIAGHAERQMALEALLDDVTDAATAQERLADAYADLLPPIAGAVATGFAEAPVAFVDLTRLERHRMLQPNHPRLELLDPQNGFLSLRGDGGNPGYHAALFRIDDGGWMLAVQQRLPDDQRTWFLRRTGDGWKDVSGEVMPDWQIATDYALPRVGRRVTAPPGLAWDWDGRRFVATTKLP